MQPNIRPSLDEVQAILNDFKGQPKAPNLIPLCATLPADLLTPTSAYLKISDGYQQSIDHGENYVDQFRSKAEYSFLFESAATTETIGRYSFVGASKYILSVFYHC